MLKYIKRFFLFCLTFQAIQAQVLDTTATYNNADSLLYFAKDIYAPSNLEKFGNNRVISADIINNFSGIYLNSINIDVYMNQNYNTNSFGTTYSKFIRPTGPNGAFAANRFRTIKTENGKKLIVFIDKIYVIKLDKIENDFNTTGFVNLNTCIDTLPVTVISGGFDGEKDIALKGDTLIYYETNTDIELKLFNLTTRAQINYNKSLFYDAPNPIDDPHYTTISYYIKEIQINKTKITTLVNKFYNNRISNIYSPTISEDYFVTVDLNNIAGRTVERIKRTVVPPPSIPEGTIERFIEFENKKWIVGRNDSLYNSPSKGLDLFSTPNDRYNFNVKPHGLYKYAYEFEYKNGLLFYNISDGSTAVADPDSIFVLNPISKQFIFKQPNNLVTGYKIRNEINYTNNKLHLYNSFNGFNFYIFPSFPFPKDLNQTCLDRTGSIELFDETQNSTFNFQWKNPSNIILPGTTKTSIKYQTNGALAGDTLIMTYTSNRGLVGTNRIYYKFKPEALAPADTVLFCNPVKRLIKAKNANTIQNDYAWNRLINNTKFNLFDTITIVDTGAYQLKVTNKLNGCFSYDTIKVSPDLRRSVGLVPLGQKLFVSCKDTVTNVLGTSATPNATFYWKNQNTNVIYQNPLKTKVFGNYNLIVTDAINGCTENAKIINIQNKKIQPTHGVLNNPPLNTVLSCNSPTVTFTGTSNTAGTIFKWLDNQMNQYPNPIVISKKSNGFKLYVTDTVLGCIDSSEFRTTSVDTAKPTFLNLIKNQPITCDDISVTLTASTVNSLTTIIWKDAAGVSHQNPYTTSQTGKYYVQATGNINGCKRLDSVNVNLIPILKFKVSNDTIICKGGTATLKASYKDPLVYTWSNGSSNSSISVQPVISSTYIVTGIKTANGCTGKDTIKVTIADTIIVSPLAFKPCDPVSTTGTIKINASGGIPPYKYSLVGNISIPFSAINNYTNVSFGSYTAYVKDSIGCVNSKTVSLNSSSSLPIPKFILNTSATKGDTVVLVDITDPKPDSVKWIFPSKIQLINNSNPSSPIILIKDTGNITIGMTAFYPNCQIPYTRTIRFAPKDTSFANPSNNNGIESITVSPNPNNGQFDLEIKFYKKQNFVVFINNINGGFNQQLPTQFNSNYFLQNILLNNATPGTYMIRVVSEFGSKQVKFIIN